jgi:hypothetical protein
VNRRFEHYRVSLQFDNPEARIAHGFPLDAQQMEVKEMLKESENTGRPFPEIQFHATQDFSNTLSAHARGRHLRHWRVLLDQILRFEIRPELGGDLRLHGSVIRKDLLFCSAAHH